MMLLLEIILLVALPYGTAILLGALDERLGGGKILSGWTSVGGLLLGIYFFHKTLEIILAS
jgi:hypothetical protein